MTPYIHNRLLLTYNRVYTLQQLMAQKSTAKSKQTDTETTKTKVVQEIDIGSMPKPGYVLQPWTSRDLNLIELREQVIPSPMRI